MKMCSDAMPSDLKGRFLPQKSQKNKSIPNSEYRALSEMTYITVRTEDTELFSSTLEDIPRVLLVLTPKYSSAQLYQ